MESPLRPTGRGETAIRAIRGAPCPQRASASSRWVTLHAIVGRFRGSFSAEHGIGRLKRDALARHKSAVALETMRAVKRAIDPKGIMNPGKVLLDAGPGKPGEQRNR